MQIKKIEIYTSKNCPYSQQLKKFLKRKGLKFQEINADASEKKAIELYQKSKDTKTPFSIIYFSDGRKKTILGFDEKVWKNLTNSLS
jgi:glutaredoxin